MLGKLMKHEFRATARTMLPLFGVVVLLAVFARISAGLLDREQHFLLDTLSVLLIAAFVISLIVVAVFSVILMVKRFHSNLMTDEGYLMFTLPVNVHQLLWSKIIVSAVWFIATFLVEALAILVMAYEGGMVRIIFEGFNGLLTQLGPEYTPHMVLFCVEFAVLMLLGLAGSCLNFYAPMSIGHAFANHKVLLSVVFYFAIQTVWQTLGSIAVALFMGNADAIFENVSVLGSSPQQIITALHLFLCGCILLAAFMGAVMYFLTAFMLKKHRNLQ